MMCSSVVRMPSGLIAVLLLTHGLLDFKKVSQCSGIRCCKIVYIFMCDSVCGSDDIYIITN